VQSNNAVINTTENSQSDKFLVTLSCKPSAPVTENLASSNTNEGALGVSSVTLDANNYNTDYAD